MLGSVRMVDSMLLSLICSREARSWFDGSFFSSSSNLDFLVLRSPLDYELLSSSLPLIGLTFKSTFPLDFCDCLSDFLPSDFSEGLEGVATGVSLRISSFWFEYFFFGFGLTSSYEFCSWILKKCCSGFSDLWVALLEVTSPTATTLFRLLLFPVFSSSPLLLFVSLKVDCLSLYLATTLTLGSVESFSLSFCVIGLSLLFDLLDLAERGELLSAFILCYLNLAELGSNDALRGDLGELPPPAILNLTAKWPSLTKSLAAGSCDE